MAAHGKNWAIVLAAGEGSRLREFTRHVGMVAPKQYCSLRGGRSLLGDALERAARIVPKKRIVLVVAEEHRAFWSADLTGFPAENIVVQPRNRGTAAGILLPLLTVLARDPRARVAILPSDHHVEEEPVIESAIRSALESLDDLGEGLTLLGIVPDAPQPGYGWIVPARGRELPRRVARFVEKPDPALADELLAQGGVWNSFLMAARGAALLRMYESRLPALLVSLRAASGAREKLEALYRELPASDFSRDVLQGSEEWLRLEVVPPCGWTDLGTPERVAACLETLAGKPAPVRARRMASSAFDLSQVIERSRRSLGAQRVATA